MNTAAPAGTAAPSRRARLRADMISQIKAEARRQLAEHGPGAISLRGIAREIGTASSALFRYFPSQGDLITALVADAYDSLADAVTTAAEARPSGDHAGRWLAICQAYRHWSLADTPAFALTHGTPLPGYQAPAHLTGPPAGRALEPPLRAYQAAVTAGAADPTRSQVPDTMGTGPLLPALLGDQAAAYEPRLAAIVLGARAAMAGYIASEIFGSLTQLVTDTTALYHAHIRSEMLAMGYHPQLVAALPRS
jgi:AcrR family transcriptional regulator